MHRQTLAPVTKVLALVALCATFVPSASACSCRYSMSGLNVCCSRAGEQKTCCHVKSQSARCPCSGREECSCSTSGRRDCSAQCCCRVKDFAHTSSPIVLATDAPRIVHYLDLAWWQPVYSPTTVGDCLLAFSLKPDIVLSHESLSAQILLGVWRN